MKVALKDTDHICMTSTILPDLFRPGLRLVICGTAAGVASAQQGAYYAGQGNRFWDVLHQVGLTSVRLKPENYAVLLDYGIGLTDLAKGEFGADADLPDECCDAPRLRRIVERLQPRILAFNGKKAASVFMGTKTSLLNFGRHSDCIGHTMLYILPSTSGAAAAHWSPSPWAEVAQLLSDEGN